jgi:hypothetical protein
LLIGQCHSLDEKSVNFAFWGDQCVLHFASYCVAV